MKKPVPQCDLKTCFFCKFSLEGWLSMIEKNRETIRFRKGQRIFEEGQPVKGIYFLYSGKVKVHKQWGTHKEMILHFAKKGDMLGYRGLGAKQIYPVTATALENVSVCYMELSFFESSLQVNHSLTYELLKFYTNELQEAEKRMRDLAHMEVKGRIAGTILYLKKRFGQNKKGFINVSLKRQDIASFSGTTYETVFRVMSEFVSEKLITTSGKLFGVLNEPGLQKLAEK